MSWMHFSQADFTVIAQKYFWLRIRDRSADASAFIKSQQRIIGKRLEVCDYLSSRRSLTTYPCTN